MKALLLLLALSAPLSADWLLHRTLSTNSGFNLTVVSPHLTNDPGLRLFVSPRVGSGGPSHPARNMGVFFSGNYWACYYEDRVNNVPLQLEFAAFLPEPSDIVFVHTHDPASQTIFKRSYLDHPDLNNKPNALLFLTHNWTAGGNTYNNQFSPVTYDTTLNRWFIEGYIHFDEFTDVPANAAWNVHIVPAATSNAYRHTATVANTSVSRTTLDHPDLNNNPNALLLVTNQWPEGLIGATFSQVQARYDDDAGRWILETLTGWEIQIGSTFHLKINPSPDTPEPTIDITSSPPSALLRIPTDFGYTYQLQASPDLGSFVDEGLPFAGNGTIRTYPTTVVLPNSHYRVVRTIGEPES